MPDRYIVLRDALICGLILSLALTTLMVISGAIALDMFVGDYPPDIKQKYGSKEWQAIAIIGSTSSDF